MFAVADVLGIFIITPIVQKEIPMIRYEKQVEQIKQQIGGLIPGVDARIVEYLPVEEKDPAREFKDGKILIQYDPKQPVAGSSQKSPIVRFYVDGIPQPDMRWDALPQQAKVRRDIEDSPQNGCGELSSLLPSLSHSTMVTVTTAAESTTDQPPSTPSPPISTPPVITPAVPGKYAIHLHQQMAHGTSSVE